MSGLTDFVLHLDKHLAYITQHYGAMTYAILFGILFLETGLVVTPFLPGDSILFTAGALAATGSLNVWLLAVVFLAGAILGDSANFEIGKRLGPRMKFIKKENIEKTEQFFAKYGGKTIIIARFVPIVRTFAPFVAGTGKMHYGEFVRYNIIGAFLWVGVLLATGWFVGNLPVVRDHFGLVTIGIVVVSLVPAAWEWIAARRDSGTAPQKQSESSEPA